MEKHTRKAKTVTPAAPPLKVFDVASFCIEFETGLLNETQIIEGFQQLIDSGYAWELQGAYGRTAVALIAAGLCTPPSAEWKLKLGTVISDGRNA